VAVDPFSTIDSGTFTVPGQHRARHNAVAAKLGGPASTPAAGYMLLGTGAGTSEWLVTTVFVRSFKPAGDGETDDTAAVEAAHDLANLFGAPVSYAGLSAIAIQANAAIAVKTPVDWAQCLLVLLGGVEETPAFASPYNELYIVSDDDCPVVEVTGSQDAANLVAGSLFPTLGIFDGHGYARVTCGLQVPDRAKTGTMDYSQAFKVNREGRVSHPLSTDISDHAAAITVRYRRTSARTLTLRNLSVVEGPWNQQRLLVVRRCNVVIEDTTLLPATEEGQFTQVNALIYLDDVSDVIIRRFITTGRPSATGAYSLQVDGGADIWVENMNALTGWGATGCNDVSGLHYRGCVINRLDAHSSGHNIFVTDCDLHRYGVVYGWGGGVISVRDSRVFDTWVVTNRSDYGGSFFGEIIVDNVEVNYAGTVSYHVVDLATFGGGLGASSAVYAPRTIRVSNVTRAGKANGNSAPLVPLRIKVRQAGDVVYAPASILVSDIMSTTLPGGWRFSLHLDVLNLERAPGAAATTTVAISHVQPTSAATSETGLIDFDSIHTPTDKVLLRVFVNDCDNFHARIRLDNTPVVRIHDSGVNGVMTPTTGTMARVAFKGCWMLVGASGYTTVPLGGGRSSTFAYTSVEGCEFAAAEQFDCSLISLAMGNTVRSGGALTPLLPEACDVDEFFAGFRASGAFKVV